MTNTDSVAGVNRDEADSSTEPHGTENESLTPETTTPAKAALDPHVAALATDIADLVESGTWNRENFPDRAQIYRQLAIPKRIRRWAVGPAIEELTRQGVLVVQLDPRTNGVRRPLPPPPPDTDLGTRTAAERLAEKIAGKIADGTWAGDKFPLVLDIKKEEHCGLHTLTNAMQILKDQGIIHKIDIPRPSGMRGRTRAWRPIEVVSEFITSVSEKIEADIRSGNLTGILPTVMDMSRRYRTNNGTVSDTYRRLQLLGLIEQVWLPDLSRRVWHVLDDQAPPGLVACETKELALATALLHRISEWLVRGPRRTWFRRPLPSLKALTRRYTTHIMTCDQAMVILTENRVLERVPIAARPEYLPLPPAEELRLKLTFGHTPRPPSSAWLPYSETHNWMVRPISIKNGTVIRIGDRTPMVDE